MNGEIHRKVDVFAFAVTMYEVVVRVEAWDDVPTNNEIMVLILRKIRPKFTSESRKRYQDIGPLFELIEKCWHQIPDERPEFSEIMANLLELLSLVAPVPTQDQSFTASLAVMQEELRNKLALS